MGVGTAENNAKRLKRCLKRLFNVILFQLNTANRMNRQPAGGLRVDGDG